MVQAEQTLVKAKDAVTAKAAKPRLDSKGRVYATGKRKNAIARVWVKSGKGQVIVNGKVYNEYFARPTLQMIIDQPFGYVDRMGAFDVFATVTGGGLSGQAGALRHGISRALSLYDTEGFRPALKVNGCLTRDARVVERKKYGRHKARRSTQFSKR